MRKGILFLMLSSLALISLSTISLAQTQVAASSTYRGDINEDGNVNIFDLLALLKVLGGEQQTERQRQIANVNTSEDGKVDIFDLLALLKVLGGAEPEIIYWGPTITGLSNSVAAVGDTLVAYLENIDEATTIGDVGAQINEQDVEVLLFTQDSVGIIIPQWFAGGQLRLVVADDTTNSVLTVVYIPGIVNSTSDRGTGSLRHAITNASPGDSITFDLSVFPPASPDTIVLVSPLPALVQDSLVIDASDAGVVIDGSMLPDSETQGHVISESESNGIIIVSNNNVIRGLHLKNFSKAGIALYDGAQNNTIGGDRNIGEGPSGQGNMITSVNYYYNCGIGLWSDGTSNNTIQGNIIGTDASGTVAVGRLNEGIFSIGSHDNLIESNLIGGYTDNGLRILDSDRNTIRDNYIGTDTSGVIKIIYWSSYGVSIDFSGYNVVGPSNVIAHHGQSGIIIQGEESVGNLITQNSIFNNRALGIELHDGANAQLAAPVLFDFDKLAATVTGVASPNCTVEVFSDNADQGEIYEGKTTADSTGFFTFTGGASFTQSHLTATATDINGNTSRFSVFTPDVPSRNVFLQEGNNLQKILLQPKRSGELENNRIGTHWGEIAPDDNNSQWNERNVFDGGYKHATVLFNSKEWHTARWDWPELTISQARDEHIDQLVAQGMTINMNLVFWDTANHPDGWEEPEGYSRFQSEEEIQRYLEYVQSMVRHFKDRIQYYELWNEPNNMGFPVQYIKVEDYINLVKRVAPVIRQEYPEAKIVIGSVVFQFSQDYMFSLVNSEEIMPLVDVLSWHPFYGTTPTDDFSRDYWYDYPGIVQAIRDTAYANGFRGELQVEELSWWTATTHPKDKLWGLVSDRQALKYRLRGTMLHLGMDMKAIQSSGGKKSTPKTIMIRNLCTLMAGTTTDSVDIQIQSDAAYLRSYSFSLPDGEKMIALWTDGVAVDDDPGVAATVTLPWQSAQSVKAIDVLNGYEQQLISSVEDGNLVIRGFLVKDYPIFISSASTVSTISELD